VNVLSVYFLNASIYLFTQPVNVDYEFLPYSAQESFIIKVLLPSGPYILGDTGDPQSVSVLYHGMKLMLLDKCN
jgi:hypothetical protein